MTMPFKQPTKAEWEAKGVELFGEDREKWSFHCPSCGNNMSIARARAEFPQLKGLDWSPSQECIGRYIDVPSAQRKIGRRKTERCNWCSYGLFRGPLDVDIGDGKTVSAFDFEGQPFTEEKAA